MSLPESTNTGALKKGVSPARNAIGLVALVALLIIGGFQYGALYGYNKAVSALDKRTQDEEKGLMELVEAETLMGKLPDGPAEDVSQNYSNFSKRTYTWRGPIKSFMVTAYYTKDASSGLHHFETDGAKYTPDAPPPPAAPVGKSAPRGKSAQSSGKSSPESPAAKSTPAVAAAKTSPAAVPADVAAKTSPGAAPTDAAAPKTVAASKAATPSVEKVAPPPTNSTPK